MFARLLSHKREKPQHLLRTYKNQQTQKNGTYEFQKSGQEGGENNHLTLLQVNLGTTGKS